MAGREGSQVVTGPIVQLSIMFGPLLRALPGWCSRFTTLGACISFVHSVIEENLSSRRELLHRRPEYWQPIGSSPVELTLTEVGNL